LHGTDAPEAGLILYQQHYRTLIIGHPLLEHGLHLRAKRRLSFRLRLGIRLRMLGTGRDRVPVVPVQQFRDRAGMHGVAHAFLECLLDGAGGDQFPRFGLDDEGLQERTLLVLSEIGVLSSAAPILLNTGRPQAMIPGHGVMDEPA
jgi:hypothetical protein